VKKVVKDPSFNANRVRLNEAARAFFGEPRKIFWSYDETAEDDARWAVWLEGDEGREFFSDSGLGALDEAATFYEELARAKKAGAPPRPGIGPGR
jgi:hypothetical protein